MPSADFELERFEARVADTLDEFKDGACASSLSWIELGWWAASLNFAGESMRLVSLGALFLPSELRRNHETDSILATSLNTSARIFPSVQARA